MTIPQNVADSLKEFDEWLDFTFAEYPGGQKYWGTMRAHLMSQDAEIERLQRDLNDADERSALRSRERTEAVMRADKAESRLAAANALLREAIEWNWLDGWNDEMGELDTRIQTHLQGAGDEA